MWKLTVDYKFFLSTWNCTLKFSKPSTSEDFILLPLTVLLLNETFTYFLPRGQIVRKQYSIDVKESIKFLCAKFFKKLLFKFQTASKAHHMWDINWYSQKVSFSILTLQGKLQLALHFRSLQNNNTKWKEWLSCDYNPFKNKIAY